MFKRMLSKSSEFGSCCKDLKDAMTLPKHSFFQKAESGVLYMAVGYVETEEGTGTFEQAVIFCPFCGTKLQERDLIAAKAHGTQ